jgi:hypothetical protein
MSSLDKLAVRFTAFALAIILLGFAVHFTEAGIDSNHTTLDRRKADDATRLAK